MITFKTSGSFGNTEKFFKRALSHSKKKAILDHYGAAGVQALAAATPIDSGKTAASWSYKTYVTSHNDFKIEWYNDNVNDNVNIAVILQYGHSTGSGYYVEGIDYINPALAPVFNELANRLWEEFTK